MDLKGWWNVLWGVSEAMLKMAYQKTAEYGLVDELSIHLRLFYTTLAASF